MGLIRNYFNSQNKQELLWSHIWKVYQQDANAELRLTKLRTAHVRLTPPVRMSVRLAAQVNFERNMHELRIAKSET